jgi:hypothetical protein
MAAPRARNQARRVFFGKYPGQAGRRVFSNAVAQQVRGPEAVFHEQPRQGVLQREKQGLGCLRLRDPLGRRRVALQQALSTACRSGPPWARTISAMFLNSSRKRWSER